MCVGDKMFQKLRISSGVNLVILSDRLFITETLSFIDLLAVNGGYISHTHEAVTVTVVWWYLFIF